MGQCGSGVGWIFFTSWAQIDFKSASHVCCSSRAMRCFSRQWNKDKRGKKANYLLRFAAVQIAYWVHILVTSAFTFIQS